MTMNLVLVSSLLSTKHWGVRAKAKNQDNVSEWSDVSTCRLWLQWTSTIKIPTKQSRHSWKIPHWFEKTITHSLIDITNIHDLFKPWYSWNTAKIGVKHQSTNQLTITNIVEYEHPCYCMQQSTISSSEIFGTSRTKTRLCMITKFQDHI
jgi:hypothetical protein